MSILAVGFNPGVWQSQILQQHFHLFIVLRIVFPFFFSTIMIIQIIIIIGPEEQHSNKISLHHKEFYMILSL